MKNKAVLELADVKLIAAAAEAEALQNSWAVTFAIVDDGGHLLWLQRLDGAPAISSHIAPATCPTVATVFLRRTCSPARRRSSTQSLKIWHCRNIRGAFSKEARCW
jgi:uncharacterized protein GlcG (DUF336 family)